MSFARQVALLWGLRLRLAYNKGRGVSGILLALGYVATAAPAIGLGLSFFQILRWQPIADSAMWTQFALGLVCFVSTAVWTAWPLLSAGVDDHSELSRYAAYPVSPWRLLFASVTASLLEPRALLFLAPVLGATAGFLSVHEVRAPGLVVPLLLTYALMNAAFGRVALHLVLNVLRQQRSAELLGGWLLVVMVGASFLPPVDTSWLRGTGPGAGLAQVRPEVIANAAVALVRVPPGFLARGLLSLARGRVAGAVFGLLGLGVVAVLAFALAYALLSRFHRASASGHAFRPLRRDPFATAPSLFESLFVREALDLWRNPKARLLAAVPFLMAVILRLFGARDLALFRVGVSADGYLLCALVLYGAVLICATFAQNTFAYDGHGLSLVLASPVELSTVLRAKNLVQGGVAVIQGAAVSCFYSLYFQHGSGWDTTLALLGASSVVLLLLSVGNFLSLLFPVKFHANLKRKDRVPLIVSIAGMGAVGLGAMPVLASLRMAGNAVIRGAVLWPAALGLLGSALLYALHWPFAVRLLRARREAVLRAVTRD